MNKGVSGSFGNVSSLQKLKEVVYRLAEAHKGILAASQIDNGEASERQRRSLQLSVNVNQIASGVEQILGLITELKFGLVLQDSDLVADNLLNDRQRIETEINNLQKKMLSLHNA